MTDGGRNGRGLSGGAGRTPLVGDRGPDSVAPGSCRVATLGRSLGFVVCGIGGGSFGARCASRSRSGLGAGEAFRGIGGPAGPSCALFRFSNLASNEDTGFYVDISSHCSLPSTGFLTMDEPSGPSRPEEGSMMVNQRGSGPRCP